MQVCLRKGKCFSHLFTISWEGLMQDLCESSLEEGRSKLIVVQLDLGPSKKWIRTRMGV